MLKLNPELTESEKKKKKLGTSYMRNELLNLIYKGNKEKANG